MERRTRTRPEPEPTVDRAASIERVEDLPEMVDRVLTVVDQVPEGKVVTYGDVGKVAGCGPRQVGQVMSQYGSMVSWWRVLRADGRAPQGLEEEAIATYRSESTPLRGDRVDLSRARHPLRALRSRAPSEPPVSPA